MPGLPQTRTHDLLTQINALTARDRDNAFLMKSLERQAEQLRAISAAEGFTVLGALAAVRQDRDNVKAFHERAIKADPGNACHIRNFAVSLGKVGAFDDSIKMAKLAWSRNPDSINLQTLVNLTSTVGRLCEASSQLREAISHREIGLPAEYEFRAQELDSVAALLSKQGITDRIASGIVNVALRIAPVLSVKDVVSRVAADDESAWVDFALVLGESVDKVGKLNDELARRLAEFSVDEESNRAISSLVVRFTSSGAHTQDARSSF